MKPRKPRKPDLFKGKRKIIPMRPPEKELSFKEKVEKFDEYVHDPQQFNKIFSELGFSYVDDGCEGECETCVTKGDCTVYPSVKEFEAFISKKKEIRLFPSGRND